MSIVKPFARILVAYDDSVAAEVALEHALVLTQQYGGDIVVVNISGPSVAAIVKLETAARAEQPELAPFVDSLDPFQFDLYQKLRARVAFVNIHVSLEFSKTEIVTGILDAAARWKATAIAIGTHARSGVSHAFLGSVAEEIVRSAVVPVIVTREKMLAKPLSKIVVGIDFAERSANASSLAVALAREHPLHLIYSSVVDTTTVVQPAGDMPFDPTLLMEGMRVVARDALDAALQDANVVDVYPETEIADAVDAATGIIDVARRREADTIIVGNHRRGDLERFFLGSTAESTMRHSHVSVIVVPAEMSHTTIEQTQASIAL